MIDIYTFGGQGKPKIHPGVGSPSISTTSCVHKKSQPETGLLSAVYRDGVLTAMWPPTGSLFRTRGVFV